MNKICTYLYIYTYCIPSSFNSFLISYQIIRLHYIRNRYPSYLWYQLRQRVHRMDQECKSSISFWLGLFGIMVETYDVKWKLKWTIMMWGKDENKTGERCQRETHKEYVMCKNSFRDNISTPATALAVQVYRLLILTMMLSLTRITYPTTISWGDR